MDVIADAINVEDVLRANVGDAKDTLHTRSRPRHRSAAGGGGQRRIHWDSVAGIRSPPITPTARVHVAIHSPTATARLMSVNARPKGEKTRAVVRGTARSEGKVEGARDSTVQDYPLGAHGDAGVGKDVVGDTAWDRFEPDMGQTASVALSRAPSLSASPSHSTMANNGAAPPAAGGAMLPIGGVANGRRTQHRPQADLPGTGAPCHTPRPPPPQARRPACAGRSAQEVHTHSPTRTRTGTRATGAWVQAQRACDQTMVMMVLVECDVRPWVPWSRVHGVKPFPSPLSEILLPRPSSWNPPPLPLPNVRTSMWSLAYRAALKAAELVIRR